jgi:hypothetical protein
MDILQHQFIITNSSLSLTIAIDHLKCFSPWIDGLLVDRLAIIPISLISMEGVDGGGGPVWICRIELFPRFDDDVKSSPFHVIDYRLMPYMQRKRFLLV